MTARFRKFSATGIQLLSEMEPGAELINEEACSGYLSQLGDDGYLNQDGETAGIEWNAYYDAVAIPEYADLQQLLTIPGYTTADIELGSRNALTDRNFSVFVVGWRRSGEPPFQAETLGPVLRYRDSVELMRSEQWRLYQEVIQFSHRPADLRTDSYQRQAWGRLRRLALEAHAHLQDFLHQSVVLTPERLDIRLRRSEFVTDDRVVEIEPSFVGAPDGWLERFDSSPVVVDRYDISTPGGICQVLISPKVKTVLREIKRLPGRRVAGVRAEAFILNPFATLGEDAKDVLDEQQFEHAREAAGIRYERFVPEIQRSPWQLPKVGLIIETADGAGPVSSETRWLDDQTLADFVGRLDKALQSGHQLLAWEGFDLELQGDSALHRDALREALQQLGNPTMQVSYLQVHDLSIYSSRIESIGVEKPYYSPYISKKKDDEGWFPDNVEPFILVSDGETEPTAIPVGDKRLAELKKAACEARAAGQTECRLPWLPKPIAVVDAEDLMRNFDDAFTDIRGRRFAPETPPRDPAAHRASKTLILRANYEERRREELGNVPAQPKLPRTLRSDVTLRSYQLEGVAWLQHLYGRQQEFEVRGAILADDMGLGKTLQLLTLVAWLHEVNKAVEPVLVVAPVALLENWVEEIEKFFVPGALTVLMAYGSYLTPLRVPKAAIDERLKTEDGLVKFLHPGWVGNHKVVLTTYETLRDFEFSFAAERWSVMICDEAQRIKNPVAMVTRAAKKQNVGFKVACTGTPVENTLADLWCLFDYVQPGLLGAPNDFRDRYRRPIEAKTDEEKARVEELRARINPQVLRRTKADVAPELPKKIVDQECRNLPLSGAQRNLYATAVGDFKGRNQASNTSPFKNHLGLLHYLRLICTDPRRHGLNVFVPEPLADYRRKSPKLHWLLGQLLVIKEREEKVIVFCEFRNIQRLLQHYIAESVGYRAEIINGDTPASPRSAVSRQKRLKEFQARPGFGVIILSPLAVGFGVNIQAANHVVHYTRTWNPAKEDQATDRAYRLGQTKDVHVYYPVVVADDFKTFDVRLDELLSWKRELAKDMLNGSPDLAPGDFSVAEVVPERDRAEMDERVDLDVAQRMEWNYLEAAVQLLWTSKGFSCYRTPASGDNGVDVVAIRGDVGELVQVKAAATPGTALGWDAVKEVVAGAAFYERRHPGIRFSKVCVTNRSFNHQARENAALNSVNLLEQDALGELLEARSISLLDVERVLYADWSATDA